MSVFQMVEAMLPPAATPSAAAATDDRGLRVDTVSLASLASSDDEILTQLLLLDGLINLRLATHCKILRVLPKFHDRSLRVR